MPHSMLWLVIGCDDVQQESIVDLKFVLRIVVASRLFGVAYGPRASASPTAFWNVRCE